MKTLISLISFCLLLTPFLGAGSNPYLTDLKKVVINSSLAPGNIEFRKHLNLNEDYEWQKINEFTDQNQRVHSRWQQYYKKTLVQSSQLLVCILNNNSYTLSGKAEKIIEDDNLSLKDPVVLFNEPMIVKGENDLPFMHSKKQFHQFWLWNPVLQKHHVVYEFITHPDGNMEALISRVNANTGNIISTRKSICSINTTGTAETSYHGVQSITTFNEQNQYVLKSTNRGQGIETINLNHQLNYSGTSSFSDTDNYWELSSNNDEMHATDAHYCAEKFYDMLSDKFNLNSINNQGFKLTSYLNYGTGLNNAFWNGNAVVYGSGNANTGPMTTLDISGHEFTHGLIQHTAALNYSNEPGTINESIADMFGVYLEYYANPQNFNWLIAEKTGAPIRSFEQPGLFNQPESYHGNNWYFGTGDNGGVHINSGFINKWFYLIVNGGQGVAENGFNYNIQSIGMEHAIAIVYHALNAYLTPESGFDDFYFFTLQSTIDLYGSCSQEYIQLLNAWQAVNFKAGALTPLELNHPTSISVCQSDSVLLIANGLPGSEYNWYKNDTLINSGMNNFYYASADGIYKVVESRCSNVTMSDSIAVTVLSLPVITATNYEICENETILLQSIPAGGTYNITNPYIGPSTSYQYTYTGNNGCSNSVTGMITVNDVPEINIQIERSIIPVNGGPVALHSLQNAIFYGPGVSNNQFFPEQFNPGDSITIFCSLTTASGCTTVDSTLLIIDEPCKTDLSDLYLNSKIISFENNQYLIELSVNASDEQFTFHWNFNSDITIIGNNNQSTITILSNHPKVYAKVMLTNSCQFNYQLEKYFRFGEPAVPTSLSVYPNPSKGEFTVSISNQQLPSNARLEVYNAEGALIEILRFDSGIFTNKNKYSAGIYFIKLISDVDTMIKKLVVN